MIKHNYVNASDNLAQWTADKIDRQEVTPKWLWDYFGKHGEIPVFRWVGDESVEFDIDPWRLCDVVFSYKTSRLFVQRKDVKEW